MKGGARILVLLGAAMALWAAPLAGQDRRSGRVVDAETGLPLISASVAAVDGAGDPLARALTDALGRFTILVPPGTVALTFSTLGYPLVRRPLSDTIAAFEVALPPDPVELDAVVATGNVQCGGRTLADTPEFARLWVQVIDAYAATAGDALPPLVYDVREFRRVIDEDGIRVVDDHFELGRRTSSRPFVGLAPPADETPRFIREEGDSVVFLAPDDRFLASQTFQESFCLDAVHDPQRALLGLRFRPRDEGDLTGVFWMSLEGQPELVELSLTYRDPLWRGRNTEATGTLAFQRLVDGRVVIGSWVLRVPELEIRQGSALIDDTRTRVLAFHEFGGRLISAREPGGPPLFDVGSGVVAGRVEGVGGEPSPAGVVVEVSGSEIAAPADESGAFRIPPLPAGRYTLRAADPRQPQSYAEATVEVSAAQATPVTLRLRAPWERRLDACPAPGAGVWVALSTPTGAVESGTSVAVHVPETGSTGRTAVDLDGGVVVCGIDRRTEIVVAGYAPVRIEASARGRVQASLARPVRRTSAEATLVGVRVLDQDLGRAVEGAVVWVDTRSSTTDRAGETSIEAARSGPVVLRVEAFGYAPFEDTVRLAVNSDSHFDVHLAPAALELAPLTVEVEVRVSMVRRSLVDRMRSYPLQVIGPDRLRRERPGGLRVLLERNGVHLDRIGLLMDARGTAGGRCRPAVWVDGRLASIPDGDAVRPFDVIHLRLEDLEVVEMHRGGSVPADFVGPGDRCGVVALWSRAAEPPAPRRR